MAAGQGPSPVAGQEPGVCLEGPGGVAKGGGCLVSCCQGQEGSPRCPPCQPLSLSEHDAFSGEVAFASLLPAARRAPLGAQQCFVV